MKSIKVLLLSIFVLILIGGILFISKPWLSPPPQNSSLYICPSGQECLLGNVSTLPKENLSTAQKKLSTDLLQLIGIINLPNGISQDTLEQQMKQNHQLKWVDDTAVSSNGTTRHKLVYVYITTNENTDQDLIKANTWNITNSDTSFNLTVAWVDTDNLQNLAMIDSVKSIRTVILPMSA